MRSITTPTKRMRLWSFNLETALFAIKAGNIKQAEETIQSIISEMRGNENVSKECSHTWYMREHGIQCTKCLVLWDETIEGWNK